MEAVIELVLCTPSAIACRMRREWQVGVQVPDACTLPPPAPEVRCEHKSDGSEELLGPFFEVRVAAECWAMRISVQATSYTYTMHVTV